MIEKKVFVDTNLSVLLVAGLCGPNFVGSHRRLQSFQYEDFEILQMLIGSDEKLIYTPNVLTETSNLLRQIRDPMRSQLSIYLGQAIQDAQEIYVESRKVVSSYDYIRLGLTDGGILECLGREGGRLLTADLDLYLAASHRGFNVENFNHHRNGRLS